MRYYLLLIIGIVLLNSCNQNKPAEEKISEKHGGVLHINISDFNWNLNPHAITGQAEMMVASQIYEGLLKYNPKNLTLNPALCKYWIFSDDGKKYTFFLRTNAFFHENECFNTPEKTRKITAHDFKYSFERLLTYREGQQKTPALLDEIEGAIDYYNATKNNMKPKSGISGINILNDSVFELTINAANSLFINTLAEINAVVVPREGIEKYGDDNYVGAGPFYIKEKPVSSESLTLHRNSHYYFNDNAGNPLPYFDALDVSFINSKEEELSLLESGRLDIICGIPSSFIPPFLEKNKEAFKGENPGYVVEKDHSSGMEPLYVLYQGNVKNFTTNRHNIIDFTRVYFQNSNGN